MKDPGSLARFRSDLVAWGRVERRSFPWRETSDPFRILVAEVLLQRSRGKTVATVYDELFHRWPDEGALGCARVTSIEAVIRPLGLTKRAVTLKALAHEVADLGAVPDTLEGLLALPGVGRYAASATLAVAFGTRAAVVDGVSARVCRDHGPGNLESLEETVEILQGDEILGSIRTSRRESAEGIRLRFET